MFHSLEECLWQREEGIKYIPHVDKCLTKKFIYQRIRLKCPIQNINYRLHSFMEAFRDSIERYHVPQE